MDNRGLKGIVIGGLAAGAFDISYACIRWSFEGVPPARIFQSVASGLLGRQAIEGGAATAALGLALHFAMTFVMAAVFAAAVRRTRIGELSPFISGPVYGAGIYLVMNRVVLPLSNFAGKQPTQLTLMDLAVHMFLVGLPIALAATYQRRRIPANAL